MLITILLNQLRKLVETPWEYALLKRNSIPQSEGFHPDRESKHGTVVLEHQVTTSSVSWCLRVSGVKNWAGGTRGKNEPCVQGPQLTAKGLGTAIFTSGKGVSEHQVLVICEDAGVGVGIEGWVNSQRIALSKCEISSCKFDK